jgi:uncharacterized protein (TIGR02118 family)
VFRRLSILVRRPSDDRAAFARKWEHHGTLVKHLPGIRAYQQNHVLEVFGHAGAGAPFRVDGVVELRFDSPMAMAQAFASEAATPVKADEPNFLGHGTGYAIAEAAIARPAEDGSKLILIVRTGDPSEIETAARDRPGYVHVIRDRVEQVIARPEMVEGPQQAIAFVHLYFDSVDHTREAGLALLRTPIPSLSFTLCRVRTLTVI